MTERKKPKSLSPLMSDLGPHPIRRDELEERLRKQTQYALELEFLFWGAMDHSDLCSFNQGDSEECNCAPGGKSWLDYLIASLHDSHPCPNCRVPMKDSFCEDCK